MRDVLNGLDPGTQLPAVRAWAIELGTTRATLSRVLKKLEGEGLVTIRGHHVTTNDKWTKPRGRNTSIALIAE